MKYITATSEVRPPREVTHGDWDLANAEVTHGRGSAPVRVGTLRVPICERSSTTASVTYIDYHTYMALCRVVITRGGGGCVSGDAGAVDGAVSDGGGGCNGSVDDGCVGVRA